MAEPLKFYLDQHIHSGIASGLRQHNIDLLTPQEARWCGLSNSDQLAFATAEERVLVTHDTDYLVMAANGVAHAGIVWVDATKYRIINPLLRMLLLLHGALDRDDMRNRVEYL